MDDNNNSTAKYRRQSLDQSDINLTLDPEKPSLSKPFKYYLFGLTSCIYLIYVSFYFKVLATKSCRWFTVFAQIQPGTCSLGV